MNQANSVFQKAYAEISQKKMGPYTRPTFQGHSRSSKVTRIPISDPQ